MSDTPKTNEVWGSMHGRGYQMMLLARKLEQELAEVQKECGTAIRKSLNEITYREMAEEEADKWLRLCTEWSEANVKLILRAEKAESRLRDSCLEGRGDQEFPPCARAIEAEEELASYKLWAEVEIADLREDGKRLNREIAELQNAFEDSVTALELAERERDKHFAASIAQNEDITSLQTELATCKSNLREVRDCANACGSAVVVAMFGNNLLNRIDAAIKGNAT